MIVAPLLGIVFILISSNTLEFTIFGKRIAREVKSIFLAIGASLIASALFYYLYFRTIEPQIIESIAKRSSQAAVSYASDVFYSHFRNVVPKKTYPKSTLPLIEFKEDFSKSLASSQYYRYKGDAGTFTIFRLSKFEQNLDYYQKLEQQPPQVMQGPQESSKINTPPHGGSIAIASRTAYAQDLQNKETIKDAQEQKEYDRIMEALKTWRKESPNAPVGSIPTGLYPGKAGNRAHLDFVIEEGKQFESLLKTTRERVKHNDFQYKKYVLPYRAAISNSVKQNDFKTAAKNMMGLIEILGVPYRFSNFDPETKTFTVQYLDSKTGAFKSTQQKSFDEALSELNAQTRESFQHAMMMHENATLIGNIEKRKNPYYGKDASGRQVLIIPQKKILQPTNVDIEVRDAKTNKTTIYPSWEAMYNAGIALEDLAREKELKELQLKDLDIQGKEQALQTEKARKQKLTQEASTSKALAEKYQTEASILNRSRREDDIDYSIKITEKMKKDLNLILMPFANLSKATSIYDLYEGNGLSEEGRTAMGKALKFYEENNSSEKFNQLSDVGKVKFDAARRVFDIYSRALPTLHNRYLNQPDQSGQSKDIF